MDWMTLSIELMGLLILGIWIVVPISEFREILAKLRSNPDHSKEDNDR